MIFVPAYDPALPIHALDDIQFAPREAQYNGRLTVPDILEFANRLYPYYFTTIEKKVHWKKWISDWPLELKVVYFDDFVEGGDCATFYRYLTAYFHFDVDVK